MELSNEQVFDMLPHAVDIYDNLDFDSYRKKLKDEYDKKRKNGKKIDPVDASVDAVKYILKNSKNVKNEIFNIIAIAENKSFEEVRKQSFLKTIATFKSIFTNEELVSFFKSPMQ
ncbi:hypothetical protein [Oceanobacillus damuensis]|uniref:hypothetical protein n=1 Tax=Oceanobacillus damuensis TaxID=937928 RepID=UPI00082FB6D6|nr:hypothetical protein [Oceanobacillus damuensis]